MSRHYVHMGFRDTNSEIISNNPQQSKQTNPSRIALLWDAARRVLGNT
jgi:hypothetical protein